MAQTAGGNWLITDVDDWQWDRRLHVYVMVMTIVIILSFGVL